MQIIRQYEKIDIKVWDIFLEQHPEGNIFQSSYMYRVYKKAEGLSPVILALIDKDGIAGILLAVIQDESNGVLSRVFRRSIIRGGPLTRDNNKEYFNKLLACYTKIIRNQAIYTEIRNLFDTTLFKDIFTQNGYVFEQHLNIIIELSKGKDQLWKELHSKRRNEVRKAQRSGVYVEKHNNIEGLSESYKILKEVYSNARLPLPAFAYFQNHLSESCSKYGLNNYVALSGEAIIGCMLTLNYKQTMYDYYAGSYRASYPKHPNDIIPWEAFSSGISEGYSIFDFGGAGKPNVKYGVRDYKKKFGGKLVNYGRYTKVHNYFLYPVFQIGKRFWQAFFAK